MARTIDADDLLMYLHCRMGQFPCDEYGLYLVADIAEYVARMPTIDPVAHGYWNERHECSECGYWNRDIFAPTPNYCARCGAKMDAKTE